MEKTLKIMAKTADDLKILSACLQDAIVPLHKATYNPRTKEFTLLLDRFQWESSDSKKGHRVHTALSIANVDAAQTKGMPLPNGPKTQHVLHTVDIQDDFVVLSFASGGKIRLKTKDLKIKLRDSGVPWPAKKPRDL